MARAASIGLRIKAAGTAIAFATKELLETHVRVLSLGM